MGTTAAAAAAETQKVINRDQQAALRVSLALKLRASKVTYADIARQCGYANAGAAHKAVKRELARVVVADVDELRREELETLDLLQLECMKLFLDKHAKGRLFAADRLLAIMERRARLMGLDQTPPPAALAQSNIVLIREVSQGLGLLAVGIGAPPLSQAAPVEQQQQEGRAS